MSETTTTANGGAKQRDPDEALRERLAAARRERERLEAEQASREQAGALLEQVEAEERAVQNAKAIADAVAKHGPCGKSIATVETRSGVVIVKRPHHVAFRKWQDEASRAVGDDEKGGLTVDSCEALVRPALVYPDPETFDKWAQIESAIVLRAANACAGLHGSRGAVKSGKY